MYTLQARNSSISQEKRSAPTEKQQKSSARAASAFALSFVKSKTTKKTGSAQSSHQGDARKKRYEKEKAIPSAKNAAENKAGRKLNRFPFLFLSEALKNFFIGVFPKPPVRTAALFPLPVMKRTFFRGNFGILDSTEKGADRTLSALKTTRAEKGERRNVEKRVLAHPVDSPSLTAIAVK